MCHLDKSIIAAILTVAAFVVVLFILVVVLPVVLFGRVNQLEARNGMLEQMLRNNGERLNYLSSELADLRANSTNGFQSFMQKAQINALRDDLTDQIQASTGNITMVIERLDQQEQLVNASYRELKSQLENANDLID